MQKFQHTIVSPYFLLLAFACGPAANQDFSDNRKQKGSDAQSAETATIDSSQEPKAVEIITKDMEVLEPAPLPIPVVVAPPDTRPLETRLCQDGQKLFGLIEKPRLGETFSLVCNAGATTPLYRTLLSAAFAGEGTPAVNLVSYSVGEMFVTKLVVAFAMKIPVNDPSKFYELKAHDILGTGIQTNNSEIVAKVESRQIFPGRRSVEEVLLNYSLNKSEGGGLFDRRRTAFNTYLLNEKKTDIVISTEELLDVESNVNYHDYRGLLIGVKEADESTYLLFINDYTIKNRLDPERLKRTLLALSQGMQTKMHDFFLSKIEP